VATQYWTSLLNPNSPWQTASGTALATAATATISPEGTGGTGPDPLVLTWWQGMVIRVRARGVYTSSATATNLTFALFTATATALASGTSLATTATLPITTTALTGLWWKLEAEIQCRAYASGTGTPTLYTHGEVILQTATPTAGVSNMTVWPMPATSGPTAANVDTTVAHTIGLVGTLSQVTGSPSLTCTSITHELVAG